MVVIDRRCRHELSRMPVEILQDAADALAQLDAGLKLSMPLSRPMPAIASGAHELRLKDASGQYRVLYAFRGSGDVHVLHAFKKTTEATSNSNLAVARHRLRIVDR